jgi:hypothetical protein
MPSIHRVDQAWALGTNDSLGDATIFADRWIVTKSFEIAAANTLEGMVVCQGQFREAPRRNGSERPARINGRSLAKLLIIITNWSWRPTDDSGARQLESTVP